MESIWNDANWISLLEAREASTGEWLGADVIADPYEDYDFINHWTEEAAIYAAESAFDRYAYGD